MISTVFLIVAGLTTGHKIGLAAVGAAFIVFALVSSFVLPRRNPDFPGRYVGVYVAVGVLFVVAMLSAVIIFGKESESSAANASPPAATTTAPDDERGSHDDGADHDRRRAGRRAG